MTNTAQEILTRCLSVDPTVVKVKRGRRRQDNSVVHLGVSIPNELYVKVSAMMGEEEETQEKETCSIKVPIHFHGCCMGCTRQETEPLNYCMGCRYFNAEWELPDLNNRPLTLAEEWRENLLTEHINARMEANPETVYKAWDNLQRKYGSYDWTISYAYAGLALVVAILVFVALTYF